MIQPGGGDVRIFGHHPRDARGGVEIRRRFAHVGEYRSNGADHFFQGPWTGLALSASIGGAFVVASLAIVERRDY